MTGAAPRDTSWSPYDWEADQVLTRAGAAVPVRATSRRPTWAELPRPVQGRIEAEADCSVLSTRSTGTGFTSGFASRLDLGDGRRIFVKAASGVDDVRAGWQISQSYREEARKLRSLPDGIGAPPLLWVVDETIDGDQWVIEAFQYVDGAPPRRPWRADQLQLVVAKLADIAPLLATAPPVLALATFADDFEDWRGWLDTVRARDGDSGWLNHIETLATESVERCSGESVTHLDLRDDNVLIGTDGQVWICDWNWPIQAAPWLDLVTLLISAAGDGHNVDDLLAEHPVTRTVEPRSIDSWLANLWLYFATAHDQEVPPHSPHLRDHQRWYFETTGDWLARRLGTAPPVTPPTAGSRR